MQWACPLCLCCGITLSRLASLQSPIPAGLCHLQPGLGPLGQAQGPTHTGPGTPRAYSPCGVLRPVTEAGSDPFRAGTDNPHLVHRPRRLLCVLVAPLLCVESSGHSCSTGPVAGHCRFLVINVTAPTSVWGKNNGKGTRPLTGLWCIYQGSAGTWRSVTLFFSPYLYKG